MSRSESDREDLMREATALTRRVELSATPWPEPIVIGIRDATGWLSVYCGADPVYTWDVEGQLRRAFVGGFLYRAQGETLARLERRRTENETELIRHDLTTDEARAFLTEMQGNVSRLLSVLPLESDSARILQTAGETKGFLQEIQARLAAILRQDRPWAAPIARRK